jgi:hypothetical protein
MVCIYDIDEVLKIINGIEKMGERGFKKYGGDFLPERSMQL